MLFWESFLIFHMPKVRISSKKDRHSLDIQLTDSELKVLGKLPEDLDGVQALKRIRKDIDGVDPGIDEIHTALGNRIKSLPCKVHHHERRKTDEALGLRGQLELYRRVGRTLKRLDKLSSDEEVPMAVQRAGVSFGVRIFDESGGLKHSFQPFKGVNYSGLFQQLWPAHEKRLRDTGNSDEEINRRKKSSLEAIEGSEGFFSLFAKGYNRSHVAEMLGENPTKVNTVLTYDHFPLALKWMAHKTSRQHTFVPPTVESVDFAYVLGAYASSKKPPTNRFYMFPQDEDAATDQTVFDSV